MGSKYFTREGLLGLTLITSNFHSILLFNSEIWHVDPSLRTGMWTGACTVLEDRHKATTIVRLGQRFKDLHVLFESF